MVLVLGEIPSSGIKVLLVVTMKGEALELVKRGNQAFVNKEDDDTKNCNLVHYRDVDFVSSRRRVEI